MTATSMIGKDIDFRTIAMIMNMTAIEIALTTLKSLSVILIKSFVHGASYEHSIIIIFFDNFVYTVDLIIYLVARNFVF